MGANDVGYLLGTLVRFLSGDHQSGVIDRGNYLVGHWAGVIGEYHWQGSLVRVGSLIVLHLLSILAGRKKLLLQAQAAPGVQG